MSNEPKNIQLSVQHEPQITSQNAAPTQIAQVGFKSTQVAHADQVVVSKNFNYIAAGGITKLSGGSPYASAPQFNQEYYNLLVGGSTQFVEEALQVGSLLMRKDRAMTACTDEVKARFGRLTDDAIELVKTLPTIIASENHYPGRTDDSHQAVFGRIADVCFEENGIRLHLQSLFAIPQQRLNTMEFELALQHASLRNELDTTHWSIKQVNLLHVLAAAGLNPF